MPPEGAEDGEGSGPEDQGPGGKEAPDVED